MSYTPAANPTLSFADAAGIPEWAKGYVGTAISGWARAAVKAAVDKDIISGTGSGQFAPANQATRAQAAKMLAALLNVRFEH